MIKAQQVFGVTLGGQQAGTLPATTAAQIDISTLMNMMIMIMFMVMMFKMMGKATESMA